MDIAIVDIECDGLDIDTVNIHCIVIQRPGHEPAIFRPDMIEAAIVSLNDLIAKDYVLAGHNVTNYDFPILRRHGMVEPKRVMDTLLMSRAIYPGTTLYQRDQQTLNKRADLRDQLKAGAHSLAAWGLRLGCPKDDYQGGWDSFNEEMLRYCVQDVATNVALLDFLRQRIPDEAAQLESEVGAICFEMRQYGVSFDVKRAEELVVELAARRGELQRELKEAFPPWVERTKEFIPKRTQRRKHTRFVGGELVECEVMEAGVPFWKGKEVEFNPASTQHITHALQTKYGWKPRHYTDAGAAKVTAEILRDLPYPECPALAEYQELKKILGYLAEGTNAWLKLEKEGRLHGSINPTGTVSGRASHNRPNLGNVPTRSELGHRCRQLFTGGQGKVVVGADASGLQLRVLAHYLAKWDGGEFARQCEEGDIHEFMREKTGLYTRDFQKTWTYAKLFGAGQAKLGQTAILDHRLAIQRGLTDKPEPPLSRASSLGRQTLDNLGQNLKGFAELERDLASAAKRGWLVTLDGRRLPISSQHIAIAMLLQGGEAVIMKKAMVLARPHLRALQAHYMLWVHDEFQVEAAPTIADHVGKAMVWAMEGAGRSLQLRVKIDGEYKVGKTWAETH